MKNNHLGIRLKVLRKSHNYTQEYVASYLNVIRQSYSHYETGRTFPSIETLQKLAELYRVPLDAFLSSSLHPDDDAHFKACYDISAKELQLLTSFRKLSYQDQEDILAFIKVKADRKK